MKFIVIAGTSTVMPFAVEVESETLEQALSVAIPTEGVDFTLSPALIIDAESGKAFRPYRGQSGWAVSDTAYARNLGVATPDEYFQDAGTMEMDL